MLMYGDICVALLRLIQAQAATEIVDAINLSQPDDYEQSGADVRDLLGRFKLANTADELRWIAAEAERRAKQPGLASPIETAYGILADLARIRATVRPPNEAPEAGAGV